MIINSRIFVTGDIHGEMQIHKLNTDRFPQGKYLTKDDYVIILGDFGLIWNSNETGGERHWLNWLEDKPWTTLFIDGNHENYDRLDKYEVKEWKGGKVHFIRPSVIHLMRGQVFDIGGFKFFTMGGARSHDIQDGILEVGDPRIKEWYKDRFKMFRVNHLSWWSREMPSAAEFNEGIDNLTLNNYKIDFILSHSPSTTEQILMGGKGLYEADELTDYLDEVMARTEFRRHYFGHLHINKQITHNGICLYNGIERVV